MNEGIINKIINEYEKFNRLFKDHDYNLDDYDEQYAIFLNNLSEEIEDTIQSDLIELCEDNMVMRQSIKEYFANCS